MGISAQDVYSRVKPQGKADLVEQLQQQVILSELPMPQNDMLATCTAGSSHLCRAELLQQVPSRG